MITGVTTMPAEIAVHVTQGGPVADAGPASIAAQEAEDNPAGVGPADPRTGGNWEPSILRHDEDPESRPIPDQTW